MTETETLKTIYKMLGDIRSYDEEAWYKIQDIKDWIFNEIDSINKKTPEST